MKNKTKDKIIEATIRNIWLNDLTYVYPQPASLDVIRRDAFDLFDYFGRTRFNLVDTELSDFVDYACDVIREYYRELKEE